MWKPLISLAVQSFKICRNVAQLHDRGDSMTINFNIKFVVGDNHCFKTHNPWPLLAPVWNIEYIYQLTAIWRPGTCGLEILWNCVQARVGYIKKKTWRVQGPSIHPCITFYRPGSNRLQYIVSCVTQQFYMYVISTYKLVIRFIFNTGTQLLQFTLENQVPLLLNF